ncbi:TPA: hypothetical protein ACLMQJ_004093 [Yersinia enterocolitica]
MDSLIAEFEAKAAFAGFFRKTLPVEYLAGMSEGSLYWESEYACMLLWPLNAKPDQMERELIVSEKIADAMARAREGKGRVIDASVVYAMPSVHGVSDGLITEVEQNTRLVRKHFVWMENGEWRRTGRVTMLGLAPLEQRGISDGDLRVTGSTQALLAEFESGNSPRAIALNHGSKWESGDV